MLINYLFFFTIFLIFYYFYWNFFKDKKLSLIFFSILVIFLYNPISLILVIILLSFYLSLFFFCKYFKKEKIIYLVFLPIVLITFLGKNFIANLLDLDIRNPINVNIFYIGLSYISIKAYLTIYNFYQAESLKIKDFILTIVFLPSYAQGPLHDQSIFRDINQKKISFEDKLIGINRLGLFVFKVIFLNQLIHLYLSEIVFGVELNSIEKEFFIINNYFFLIPFCLIRFLEIYINFSGYVDLSIGTSRLLGIRLPENFNEPWKSNNIVEFWTRWHITLSDFVRKHIWFPLAKVTGKPNLAIFISFILVGIWHDFTLGYLVWGIGHGLCLAFNKKIFIFDKYNGLINKIILLIIVSFLATIGDYTHLFF